VRNLGDPAKRQRWAWTSRVALISILVATVISVPGSEPAAAAAALPTLSSPLVRPPTVFGSPAVQGLIRAPGGPYLIDSHNRVIFFHGVNVVYKYPPYEVYPAPGKPWNFNAHDASLIARLGFNVVRLGMTWQGLEPGTAGENNPTICKKGNPANPAQFNPSVLQTYLDRLQETVDLLGRYHIYSLLDMHQDVYNQSFDGEGAPAWAVCTNGVPSVDPPGRWSAGYATTAAGIAFHHFWTNNVVGDLQGEYDRIWGDVAQFFSTNPWVLGYDPFNEPFSTSLLTLGDEHFDAQLECFYTGSAFIGAPSHGAPAIRCPKGDPAVGVIPTILANDPNHLIFDEPDNYASRGFTTYLGPMNFPNLVFNVHIYCSARNPATGNPVNIKGCEDQEQRSLSRRAEDRPEMASAFQRAGPAWFVSEFGASSNPQLLAAFTAKADLHQVGWAYWSWKYYRDPTGSSDEALLMRNGRLRSTAAVLSATYPEAVAGTPKLISFSPATGTFRLEYSSSRLATAPTVVFVPTRIHYPGGYCARASGARIVSKKNTELLVARNSSTTGRLVTITIQPGGCKG
jgi:endoglycosylceramidase